MPDVREISFVPDGDGGEIRTSLGAGGQEVAMRWHLDARDSDLQALLEPLLIRIRQIDFVQGPDAGEIRAVMSVGEREFISAWPVDDEDPDMKAAFERLRSGMARSSVRRLHAMIMEEESAPEPIGVGAPFAAG